VERVSTIAVVLALFPASVAAASLTERWKFGWLPPLAAAAMPLLCALDLPASRPVATAFSQNYELLPLGFSDDQEQFIQGVNRLTEPSARILIEERHEGSGADWNWTALLARRTGRAFLGGLDPEAGMEHLFCGLSRDRLNGRRLADVSDDDLHAFADRYNVGWVLCRSESSAARWRSTARVREVAQFRDHGPVTMFAIDRPHQYLVRGSGRLERADRRRIVLRDLEPDATGTATLAFHYQPGLRIMPPSVIAEREKDPFDPIPLIRLRLPGKVTRVTLFWERP
jgi:hypothetical protein